MSHMCGTFALHNCRIVLGHDRASHLNLVPIKTAVPSSAPKSAVHDCADPHLEIMCQELPPPSRQKISECGGAGIRPRLCIA